MEQSAALPVSTASDGGEFLWGFWYPVLRGKEIRGRRLVTAQRLEIPLVLGRDAEGKPFALRDVCPTAPSRFRLAIMTGRPSNAPTTAGVSTRIPANVASFPPSRTTRSCSAAASLPAASLAKSATVTSGPISPTRKGVRLPTARCRLCRNCRNTAATIALRISLRPWPAAWIPPSSG